MEKYNKREKMFETVKRDRYG